jgi:hypothetical protein
MKSGSFAGTHLEQLTIPTTGTPAATNGDPTGRDPAKAIENVSLRSSPQGGMLREKPRLQEGSQP